MIRSLVISSLVVAALGGVAAPALAAGTSVTNSANGTNNAISTPQPPTLPGFTTEAICVAGDDPNKGLCVWVPLPI